MAAERGAGLRRAERGKNWLAVKSGSEECSASASAVPMHTSRVCVRSFYETAWSTKVEISNQSKVVSSRCNRVTQHQISVMEMLFPVNCILAQLYIHVVGTSLTK